MRFIHDNLKPLLITLMLIAAITAWFGTTGPTPPSSTPQADETWVLPALPENASRKYVTAINDRNLWGAAIVEAPSAPEWHVAGVVKSGKDRFLLLALESKPIETLKIGDKLPDGAKITRIEKDRFFVVTPDNKKLTIGLNKHDKVK